eukprot:4096008-Amphidinium_carterae.2
MLPGIHTSSLRLNHIIKHVNQVQKCQWDTPGTALLDVPLEIIRASVLVIVGLTMMVLVVCMRGSPRACEPSPVSAHAEEASG